MAFGTCFSIFPSESGESSTYYQIPILPTIIKFMGMHQS